MPFHSKPKIYKGRGLKVKVLKDLLKASYLKLADTPEDIGDYFILPHLSTDEVKVFLNDDERQFVIVIRGTDKYNPKDLYTDAKIALQRTDTARFTSAKETLDRVISIISRTSIFDGFKIDIIGHSLGGKVAYEISRKSPASQEDTSLRDEINDVITLNSAGTFSDKKTKNPFNKWDIRSEFDFLHKIGAIPPEPYIDPLTGASNAILINPTEEEKIRRQSEKDEKLAQYFQNLNLVGAYRNLTGEIIPGDLQDLLYEHEIDRLDRLDQERFIGRPTRGDDEREAIADERAARADGSGLRKQKKKNNNKWIEHVLKYQKKYKVPYNIALKEAKKTYY
jgi:pimeloyl-ACP methyl ester carboxylesterase